ncbi:MAG TPA: (deoxy)nucleoside triphosphate pyrophosphohydrolase [Candidatus Omnitrophota bacterium]|nr:(deoxy)nucleoside triphosphate pyrophosphohydrolase [Candidatus Omnitrophota bacterium]HPS37260.1 (deoxy)nucleoside triphosphate pyrophosphohydrolase [Candidatus Omnitrophota bacterium]
MLEIEVGCAIIYAQDKVLIAQRHLEDSFGGYWEFPGGTREPGETLERCLEREVFEELGVRIRPEKFLCRRDHEYVAKKIALFFWLCAWVEGEPVAHDCKDFRWVSREEIRQVEFIPGDQDVLAGLLEHWEEYFKTRENSR